MVVCSKHFPFSFQSRLQMGAIVVTVCSLMYEQSCSHLTSAWIVTFTIQLSILTLFQQDQMSLAARKDERNKSGGSSVREKKMRYSNQIAQANSGFLSILNQVLEPENIKSTLVNYFCLFIKISWRVSKFYLVEIDSRPTIP